MCTPSSTATSPAWKRCHDRPRARVPAPRRRRRRGGARGRLRDRAAPGPTSSRRARASTRCSRRARSTARSRTASSRSIATRVSARDVAEVLSKAPAPRIMLVHGGVYPVHLAMVSFGTFLAELGYPEAKIRDPGNGDWSYSPYTTTARLAGIAAWHYEQDGLRPMIIGHSQGGLYVVKVLKELAGTVPAAGSRCGTRSPTSEEPRDDDRRPDDRARAPGGRRLGVVRGGARRRRLGARAAQPMGRLREPAQDPGHRPGVHRLLHRARPLRAVVPGQPARRALRSRTARAKVRNVTLPARHQPRVRPGDPPGRRRARRCAPGSTPTRPTGPMRTRRPA